MALKFFYYSNSESFDRYRKEIADIPLLSEEDEKALGVEAKKGNFEARDILVNSLLKYVVSIAKNYQNRGVALEDLVSEGNIGLLYAVEGFDPNEGRLSTYASYWIKKAINDVKSGFFYRLKLERQSRQGEHPYFLKSANGEKTFVIDEPFY